MDGMYEDPPCPEEPPLGIRELFPMGLLCAWEEQARIYVGHATPLSIWRGHWRDAVDELDNSK